MRKILGAALAAMLTAGAANATIFIDSTNAYSPNQYAVGTGSSVSNFAGYVNAQGASAGALSNADLVNSATALILNLRVTGSTSSQLSSTEITNLQAFIATGKRVLIIGENNNFAGWDQSFISAVGNGAQYSSANTNGSTTSIANNDLTGGVTTATINGGGTILGGN